MKPNKVGMLLSPKKTHKQKEGYRVYEDVVLGGLPKVDLFHNIRIFIGILYY